MTAYANPLHQVRERGRDNVAVYAVLVIEIGRAHV